MQDFSCTLPGRCEGLAATQFAKVPPCQSPLPFPPPFAVPFTRACAALPSVRTNGWPTCWTTSSMSGRRREPRRRPATLAQIDWELPDYLDRPIEPLDGEALERVHDAAMRILEEIGIDFLHPEARRILRGAGCDVDEDSPRVRMDRGFIEESIARAPAEFSITPRNPDRAITWGGRRFTFGAVASPPNVSDIEKGRRSGNRQDFADLVRLTQIFNCLHFHGGYPVEPVDVHASIRHLDAFHDLLTLSDKVCHAYSLGPERIEDAMEMVRIAAGISEEPDTIMDVYEPYLLQLGFLQRTSRGRLATRLAYEHLGIAYPEGEGGPQQKALW